MPDAKHVYIAPDTNNLYILDDIDDNDKAKLFLYNSSPQNINRTAIENISYILGAANYVEDIKDQPKEVAINKDNEEILLSYNNPALTKLICLVKASKNISLLKRLRSKECLVLARCDGDSIEVYRTKDYIPAFSSTDFLKAFLKRYPELDADYKMLKVYLYELDYFAKETVDSCNVCINPRTITKGVNYSLLINKQLMEKINDA